MNILVTDFQGAEDVMVIFDKSHYPNITPSRVEEVLREKKQSFNEVYEVADKDLQFYIYDPCHLDKAALDNLNNVKTEV